MCGYLFLLMLDRVLFAHSHDAHNGGHHGQNHSHIDESDGSSLILQTNIEMEHIEEDGTFPPATQISESSDALQSPPANVIWNRKAITASLLIVAMLSVHSFFEGLVLGVQDDTESTVAIIVAILTHKWVESLSLGTLTQSEPLFF